MDASNEVVGITACLDQVTRAFNDGQAILDKIKKQRAVRRVPLPPRLLEESVEQAPLDIEREKQRGLERFGPIFEDGDHIAVIALQQIIIQLQQSLLEKLRIADDDVRTTDFTHLVDAADLGRDRTIAALHEFKQRLITAENGQGEAQQPVLRSANSSNSDVATDAGKLRPTSSPKRPTSQLIGPKGLIKDGGRHASGEEDASGGAEDASTTSTRPRKRDSLLGFLRHHRTNSGSEGSKATASISQPLIEEPAGRNSTTSTAGVPVPFRPPPNCDSSTVNEKQNNDSGSLHPTRPQPKFRYEEWEENSPDIWNGRPSTDRHQSLAVAPGDQPSPSNNNNNNNVNSIYQNPSNLLPLQPPSPVLTNRSNSNPHSSMVFPTPNPENDFLGFCKAAVKLQNGDRKSSMTKCKEVEPWSRHPSSHATSSSYLACSQPKCAFRSSFSNPSTDVIWRRVFKIESKGIKIRWQFLAKSHVLQKVVVKHQYSFKCLFCIFLGNQAGVYHGMDDLLEHINQEHRGRMLGDVVLYKTGCINDRVAGNEEEFDINLWPLNVLDGKQEGVGAADDLLEGKEANDSMFSSEPWNEGLSDFHYGGGETEYISGLS